MLLSKTGRGLTALRQIPAVQRINAFMAQPGYILLAALLAAVCNIVSLEWLVYPLFVLAAVYICLLGEDLLPLMPLVLFSYLAPSRSNNPGAYQESFFFVSGALLPILAAVLILALLLRIFTDPQRGGKVFFTKKRPMALGLLLLWVVFAISGAGTEGFGLKSVAFGLLEGAAFAIPYFLFTGMVDWQKARKDYFLWLGFAAGVLVLTELIWLYAAEGVIAKWHVISEITNRTQQIRRSRIFTGWGMYNNIGAMLATMIPFAFVLADRYRKSWLGYLLGSLFLVGVIFTCSRSSILFGAAGWLLCALVMLWRSENRKASRWACGAVVLLLIVLVGIFHRQLADLFVQLVALGADPSSRDWLYDNAFSLFTQHPILGISFYPPTEASWSWSQNADFYSFFPARWHNTLFQLLATGGIAAVTAYAVHRIQSLQVFLKDMNREKAFIGCSVLILLGCSLLDCHLFNIGPTLFYSMALAVGENCKTSEPLKKL